MPRTTRTATRLTRKPSSLLVRGIIIAAAVSLAGGAAAQPSAFSYQPTPRWTEDPETEVVCAAIQRECAGMLKGGSIDAEWSYAELYDADGMLVGLQIGRASCRERG